MSRRSVLLTCSGQRVDVVRGFQEAIDELGWDGVVVAVDNNELAPTLFRAGVGEGAPPISSADYIPALLDLVRAHGVIAVLPLTDLDSGVLVGTRDRFAAEGATVFLPDADVVEALYDKLACHQLLESHGIGSPPTWLPEDARRITFPALVKQRWGFGSQNIHRCDDAGQLAFFLGYVTVPVMVQQLCLGPEFSIDVLCDMDGRALNAIPRSMIQSKGGESIKGMTLDDRRLVEFGRDVAETLGLRGPATIQCFDEDGRLLVTDVNTRFGGAFALPLAAGSRYPELVMRMAAGERVEPAVGRYTPGVVMTRYFETVVLRDHARLTPIPAVGRTGDG